MKHSFLVGLLALFLIGCGGNTFNINTTDSTAFSKDVIAGNNLMGDGFEFNPMANIINKKVQYSLYGVYRTTCENAFNLIENIKISIDNEELNFKTVMPSHLCDSYTNLSKEGAAISLSNEDFSKILSSKKLNVTLTGNGKTRSYAANETFKQNLITFKQKVEENLK